MPWLRFSRWSLSFAVGGARLAFCTWVPPVCLCCCSCGGADGIPIRCPLPAIHYPPLPVAASFWPAPLPSPALVFIYSMPHRLWATRRMRALRNSIQETFPFWKAKRKKNIEVEQNKHVCQFTNRVELDFLWLKVISILDYFWWTRREKIVGCPIIFKNYKTDPYSLIKMYFMYLYIYIHTRP